MTSFDKYAQEGNTFVKKLAQELGHPDEIGRSTIVLRSVLHTLRDRITIGESLNLMAQLPAFLKALYVEDWKYKESVRRLQSVDDFTQAIKDYQSRYGEQNFDWQKSTEEITRIVLEQLSRYISEGEAKDIISQLPEELKAFFTESIIH